MIHDFNVHGWCFHCGAASKDVGTGKRGLACLATPNVVGISHLVRDRKSRTMLERAVDRMMGPIPK